MSDEPTREPQSPGMVKAPNSLRVMQIVVGTITLVPAAIVLAFPGFAIILITVWLSMSLLFGGIEGVVMGVGARHMSRGWRAASIGVGAVAIGLSIAVFAFPLAAAALTLVLFLSIALLFLGAGGIARGLYEKRMEGWARAMFVAVGAITVALSIAVLIFPGFGLFTLYALIALISAALIVNGASYIVSGITGVIFRPISIGFGRGARRL
jgi:uncharacterized membrane protein HdeD (DUF308 family)